MGYPEPKQESTKVKTHRENIENMLIPLIQVTGVSGRVFRGLVLEQVRFDVSTPIARPSMKAQRQKR